MFSFNGPHGACPACDGLGSRDVVDPERVIGEQKRSLREGVVLAWGRRASVALLPPNCRALLPRSESIPTSRGASCQKKCETRFCSAFRDLAQRANTKAGKKKAYEGIVPRLEARLASGGSEGESERTTIPTQAKVVVGDDELGRFVVTRTCDACKGRRLQAGSARRQNCRQRHFHSRRHAPSSLAHARRNDERRERRHAVNFSGTRSRHCRAAFASKRSARASDF